MADHNHHNHHDHDHHMPIFENKLTLPVLIIALTLALMTTFQMRQIMMERKLVHESYAAQEQALGQSKQVSQQFESLAVGTARLAGEGNATAQGIVADLRRVGITINPNAKGNEKAIEQKAPEAGAAPAADNAPLAMPAPSANKPVTTPPAANSEPAPAGVGQ